MKTFILLLPLTRKEFSCLWQKIIFFPRCIKILKRSFSKSNHVGMRESLTSPFTLDSRRTRGVVLFPCPDSTVMISCFTWLPQGIKWLKEKPTRKHCFSMICKGSVSLNLICPKRYQSIGIPDDIRRWFNFSWAYKVLKQPTLKCSQYSFPSKEC